MPVHRNADRLDPAHLHRPIEALFRRRRLLSLLAVALSAAALPMVFGHRGTHMVRSVVVPGAGLYEEHRVLGIACTLAAGAATIAWLRWGVDWLVAAVSLASVVGSGVATGASTHLAAPVARAAHEFPLVVLVAAALGWVRRVLHTTSWARVRPATSGGLAAIGRLGPVERCQCAAIVALAGSNSGETSVIDSVRSPDVAARSRRIGLVARGRWGGDPFRRDHAHVRAALSLHGALTAEQSARFTADAASAVLGVPAREPGWIRPLDATLAALALVAEFARTTVKEHLHEPEKPAEDVGDRSPSNLRARVPAANHTTLDSAAFVGAVDRWLPLRRGHRPAWFWTPLGISGGRADDWEHATWTVLAHGAGWIGSQDWAELRKRALGASARGTSSAFDERLIAAGRCWAVLVSDDDADALLRRPTVGHDPLAVALDHLATALRGNPTLLRTD